MTKNSIIDNPFTAMKFDGAHCFLCGTKLKETNRSDEHFFPKWLLKKYNMWNQGICLQNDTKIKYKSLKIPCCKQCNNEKLNRIEDQILSAVEKGYEEFVKLDEIIVFQWIGKIYYGNLFKELFLDKDIKAKSKEKIINPQQLIRFEALHNLLQSIRIPFKFCGDKPWSIFICKMQHLNNQYDFDYYDSNTVPAFAIRLGEIGIVGCFGDQSLIREILKSKYNLIKGHRLHPIQLTEFFVEIIYTVLTLGYNPSLMFIEHKEEVNVISADRFSKEYIDPNNQLLFAKIFAKYLKKWGIKLDMLYNKESKSCCTFLTNEEEEFHEMDYAKDFAYIDNL